MRILLPVAAPISYNPAFYLEKAFGRLGHTAKVITQSELYECSPADADLFVGVDSGGPLNIPTDIRHRTCMWFIDSRRNCNPELRTPDDDTVAIDLLNGGGTVFQAQMPDVSRLLRKAPPNTHVRIGYLPLAADPNVWSPHHVEKRWPAVFVGNCYDATRLGTLNKLSEDGWLYWPGIEGALMEEGAAAYSEGISGLNIPSFWGEPTCYDVNMRVFEILACGIPLITNNLSELPMLGITRKVALTYTQLDEIPSLIRLVIQEDLRGRMGEAARELILQQHTYKHRANSILDRVQSMLSRAIVER